MWSRDVLYQRLYDVLYIRVVTVLFVRLKYLPFINHYNETFKFVYICLIPLYSVSNVSDLSLLIISVGGTKR